ncbi:hypothetical protein Hypma_009517 [Hypsizygus marmoreus]|uniref:Uncharacterized protein n=1 Tax=Hypsizygus marmoreus TaxID=39966 RepID=A0A369JNZ3_HYPMA|nr:hypothetical protein Hypma_009517 [Hypsizygus marmoreus]
MHPAYLNQPNMDTWIRPQDERPSSYRIANCKLRMRQLSRKFRNLPGPIDSWLSANARDAWTNDVFLHGFLRLMMADVPKTQVFCPTEREEIQAVVIFTGSDWFNLYLTATLLTDLEIEIKISTSRVSSRAVLDTYIGLPEHLCAPGWMNGCLGHSDTSLFFFMNRVSRANFLSLLALMFAVGIRNDIVGIMWRPNLSKLTLQAGTLAEGEDLAPSTRRNPVKKWNSPSQKGKWAPEILDKELNGSLWEFEDTPS